MKRIYPLAFASLLSFSCGGGSSPKVEDPGDLGGGDGDTGDGSGTGGDTAVAPPACSDEGAGHDFGAATSMALGAANGCTASETDVYSILAPNHAPGTLYEVTVEATKGSFAVGLYDGEETELATAAVAAGQKAEMFVVLASDSSAYLKVAGTGEAVMPYAVSVKASPLIDEDEPNDTAEQASPLNLNTARSALLQTAANNANGSVDFYRVLVSRSGTLKVEVEPGTDEITLAVEVFDRAGKQIGQGSAENPGAKVTVEARVKKGDFTIKVAEATDDAKRSVSVGTAMRYLKEQYTITATAK